jgi:GxxExxY protein
MSHGFSPMLADNSCSSSVNSLVIEKPLISLKHSELTDRIIAVFYNVYNELGFGFLESTYAEATLVALQQSGLTAVREVSVPVWFRGVKVGQYFADILVDDKILLELKSARSLDSSHEAQLLHYLRATKIEVGLLLNFGTRPQFRRLIFDNDRKMIRVDPCKSVAKVSV